MRTSQGHHVSPLWMLLTLLFGITIGTDARATNMLRMCAKFTTSYSDVLSGQDVLINAQEPARRHRAMVISPAFGIVFNHYLDDNGCTPLIPIGAVTHEFRVTNRAKIAVDKDVLVYNNTTEQDVWHVQVHNTPPNPLGNSSFTSTFTGTLASHVSLLAARLSPSGMVVPSGAAYVEYKIYANINGLSGLRSDGNVDIGRIIYNGQTANDARWRSVIAHELGHQVAYRMFGIWYVNYSLTPSTVDGCHCGQVEDPIDRAHCLASNEYVGAARSEAWAHSFATAMLNLQADSPAVLSYYKRFHDPARPPGDKILYPPFPVNALGPWQWQDAYCPQSNSGMEMDWMSFFYSLDNRTTDAYTIGNFWNVFQTECGVPPIDLCVVSWDSLVTAAESWFGPTHTKALYLSGLGSVHGVDH